MNISQGKYAAFDKIAAFEYKGGKSVTSKLCELLHVNEYQDLAEVFAIPRGTVSTWHTRETTPYEIAIRAHLSTGVSLRWLLLDEGEAFPSQIVTSSSNPNAIQAERFQIKSGKLVEQESLVIDKSLLDEPESLNLIAIDDTNSTFIIDKDDLTIISGKYLISTDELLSLNDLQRLPGKKVAMSFGNSSIEVAEGDIKVLGKVVIVMGKE